MLTGNWKSIVELEDILSLDELELIVSAAREKEHRMFKMMAAVQGHNVEDEEETDRVTVDDIKARVAARLSGKTLDELELPELGLDVEIEE